MALKQSFSWWCYAGHGVSDDDLMAGAKRIGYPGVDICPPEHFERAHKLGLEIASLPGHKLEKIGLNDPKHHEAIAETIRGNIKVAVEHRIPNLIVFSGERGLGISDEEGIVNSAKGLKMVAAEAEKAGIMLVVELLNSRVDHGGYMCDKTQWGVEVCKLVGSPNVKLLYDIYHMQIMEGDIIRTIRNNHQWFGHYHTGGNPGRNDIDETQELYYPPIMKAINDTGYDRWCGHEFIPKGDPLEAMEAAFKLCNGVGCQRARHSGFREQWKCLRSSEPLCF